MLKEGLAGSGVKLITPRSPEPSAGIVCCEVSGSSAEEVVAHLRDPKVVASPTPYRPSYLRFGPTIANNESDVEAALQAVRGR